MKKRAKDEPLHIALSIEQDSTFGRQIVAGIISFLRKRPLWQVEVRGEHPFLTPKELMDWEGDGIISQIYQEDVASHLASKHIPLVNTASRSQDQFFPTVSVDNYRLGELAAEHLASKNLTEFAYIQMGGLAFGGLRYRGFYDALQKLGHRCQFVEIAPSEPFNRTSALAYVEQLKKLPRPVGIFAFNDRLGFGIMEACRSMKIKVPDDVCLISVDNDETLCNLAYVQMSSIDPGAWEIGYRAAELLDQLIQGKPAPRQPILVQPEGIVERGSSDVLSVDDPMVANALRFIRNHDSEPIQVSDVVEAIPLARRALERRFREAMGCSVYDEIRRTRIERAKALLRETDMTSVRIGRTCGFNSIQRFEVAFRELTGMTTAAYRRTQQ